MKATKKRVELFTEDFEEIQIDGIPEGFSFKVPSYKIGEKEYGGYFIAYIPFSEMKRVKANTEEELLELYKKEYGEK